MENITMTLQDTVRVSVDQESRDAKEGKDVLVTFKFENWTAKELCEKLAYSSNSPKVAVQALLRKMKSVPETYTYIVPKQGARTVVDPLTALINKFGSVEAAIEELKKMQK